MPIHPDRRARLEKMIALLGSSKRGWTVKELAKKFYLSERQIQRDLLEIQGEPYYVPLRFQRRDEYIYVSFQDEQDNEDCR